MSNRIPVVAIVGRPNVGKSTLFNRLAGSRIAIIEDKPGVTRDRIYSTCEWNGRKFTIIDTGGFEPNSTDILLSKIREQANIAIDTADVIIFVTDGRDGVTTADREIADILRKSKKDVIIACNKLDNINMHQMMYDFYELGFDSYILSAVNGIGTGDILDAVVEKLPAAEDEGYDESILKVAVIGRPNAGKSSLINKLLGEERVIVSDTPGTTRDAIDTPFEVEGKKYVFIDTAGIRRKNKVDESIEYYSVLRAFSAIDRSDICLMVIDASIGLTEQDTKITGYADEQGKGMLILMNKWDLVEKNYKTADEYTRFIKDKMKFLHYAPILYISAKTGQRTDNILKIIDSIDAERSKRIKTGVLNDMLNNSLITSPLPPAKGKRLKIYYCTQVAIKPPTFVFFTNMPNDVHFSYYRFLENEIRRSFGFEGTPIKIIFRLKEE